MRAAMLLFALLATGLAARAQDASITLEPYVLSSKAQLALEGLAGHCDILILGEIHGTQEVAALSIGLLAPLTKLDYGILALEIPADEQQPLADWAAGKTTVVPSFFAKPWEDGRGSIQVLALIRAALSSPYNWQLICFDQSRKDVSEPIPENIPTPSSASSSRRGDPDTLTLRRDAIMASNVEKERARIAPHKRVLAICGNLHARTTSPTRPDSPARPEWPSFAAALQSDQPTWRVRSVNVVPHDGAFFAMQSSPNEQTPRGKIIPIRVKRRLNEAEAHPLIDKPWDWELNLPKATPATFLATPSNDGLFPPTALND